MKRLLSYKFFVGVIFSCVLAIIIYNHYFYEPDIEPMIILDELSNIQESALAKLSQMIELLLSLSTALFAVVGYFAIEQLKGVQEIKGRLLFYAGTTLSFAALSIDYGYITLEKWVELLGNGTFNPFDSMVLTPLNRQFFCFLIALIFLGLFILACLNRKKITV